MFPGSPAPLPHSFPFDRVAALAAPGEVLGVWARSARWMVRIRVPGAGRALLLSADLGVLLRRCGRVAVRDGSEVVVARSERLIELRVLEIVLGAPYLPPPHQLRALFPAMRVREGLISLPIGLGSAEEALGLCAAVRLPVVGSRIRYAVAER